MNPHRDREGAVVLVVDDDELIRVLAREALEDTGFRVCEAHSGTKALEQFQKHRPEAVLLDLNMPRLDGYSLLLRLKENDRTSRIPIVILSTQPEDENQDICRTFGPIQFVEKPFRIADVACKVAHALT